MSAINYVVFRFYGNKALKQKVAQWRRSLKACEGLDDSHLLFEQCRKIFDIARVKDFSGSNGEYNGNFKFILYRFPVFQVTKLLLKRLIQYDRDAVIEIFYEFEGSFGYRFMAISEHGRIIDKFHHEVSAFLIDYDEHDEMYFDEGNDDGGDDVPQLRRTMVDYYLKRISDIDKLRIRFPASDNELKKREEFVRRRLEIARLQLINNHGRADKNS